MMEWREVTTDGETHLQRVIEMYEELGFEVLILPTAEVETERTCDECIQADTCTLVTIFTRPNNH